MSFEIGKAFNGGAEWVCGSPLAFGALRNPVYTAFLITALALVIIFTLYRPALKRRGWRLGVKTGFWLLIAVSAVTYAHYYALERHLREGSAQKELRAVVDSVRQSAQFGGGYPVHDPDAAGGDDAPSPAPDGPTPPGGQSPVGGGRHGRQAGGGRQRGGRPDNVGGAGVDETLVVHDVVLPSTQAPGVRPQKR